MVPALPVFRQRMQHCAQFSGSLRIVRERKGFAAREFEQLAVAYWIRDVKAHVAGLACAEKFARAAQQQISFSDFESVGGAYHRFEARPRFLGHITRRHQNAMRFGSATSDAAAQLMQLRQAKAL